jgi:predicted ABC-class ATPase
VDAGLYYHNLDQKALAWFIATIEDQESLRSQLESRGLVAFIADGAVLPRASGASDLPLNSSPVVKFKSSAELRVQLQAPNRGIIEGMGIPSGVTLIVAALRRPQTLLRHWRAVAS